MGRDGAMGMSIFSMSVMSIIALEDGEREGELHLVVQIYPFGLHGGIGMNARLL